jgi:hypothetical protein
MTTGMFVFSFPLVQVYLFYFQIERVSFSLLRLFPLVHGKLFFAAGPYQLLLPLELDFFVTFVVR